MITKLDTKGLLCPLPVLKARKTLSKLAQGDILHVFATDPAAIVDCRIIAQNQAIFC